MSGLSSLKTLSVDTMSAPLCESWQKNAAARIRARDGALLVGGRHGEEERFARVPPPRDLIYISFAVRTRVTPKGSSLCRKKRGAKSAVLATPLQKCRETPRFLYFFEKRENVSRERELKRGLDAPPVPRRKLRVRSKCPIKGTRSRESSQQCRLVEAFLRTAADPRSIVPPRDSHRTRVSPNVP